MYSTNYYRIEILYLRSPYVNHDGISAKKIKEELDTTFHSIVVTKEDGVYYAPDYKVFDFLAYYIHSFQQLSDVLIEYGDEKDLCERFLLNITSKSEQYFLIEPSEKAFYRCIERIFKAMTKSEELFSYILNKRNNININCINAYIQKLNKEQIKVLIDTACIEFINNVCLIEAEDMKGNINMEMRPHIVIPSDCTTLYTKRVFDNLAESDCVESCLLDNRNKQNRLFRTTLQTYMTNINRHELETLIKHAGTSEFINRMLVISEEEIKSESYWQYERYGIVLPTDYLHMYIERVLDDLKGSLYLPMNRNTENKSFREEIYRHISSLSKDEIESMIQKGSSKFISRMFMSTNGDFEDIRLRRDECYLIFIPKQNFERYRKHWSGSEISSHSRSSNSFDCKTTIIKDSSSTFTLFINEDSECEIAMVTVRRENELNIDKLPQHLNKYVDPILTSKRIDCCVKSTSDFVEIYIQRMIADWMQGNVHDVLGNINLNNQTFLCRFLTHLRNFDVAKQAGLVKTIDSNTGDSPLAVCCYVGNIQLVKWCLDNNANTNSRSKYEEYPLQIACLQNYPDILFILLNHKDKADFNTMTGIVVSFYTKPFYEACKKGHTQIVSLLLKEKIDINDCQNDYSKTPLFAACKYGHIDIVSMLLKHKAVDIDVNIGGNFDEEKETTPLFIACKKGHTEIVSLLLNHNVDEVNVKKHTRQWETPLYAACEGGFNDIVELLLSHKPEIVNKSRMDGATPLFVVCQEGHLEVVSTLLNQKGIAIDKCTATGMSPLFIASLLGHSKIVQILLRRNADASICVKNTDDVKEVFTKFRNRYRYTSKIPMEFRRFVRYMKNLIIDNASENVKSHVERKAEDGISNIILGSSPIHMGSFMGHTDIVKLLVNKMSMEINKINENGSTPLFLSCEQGHEDIVRILMENGANPTLERKDGKSPLSIAKEIGHTKIVEILNLTTIP